MVLWSYDMRYCPQCRAELEERVLDGKLRKVCNNCGFVFWNNPIPVVAAIVPYRGKLVLVKSSIRKTWGLPAGHVEEGDTAEERVIDEVNEETGLDVEITGFLGTWRSSRRNIILLMYVTKVLGGNLRPGGDAEDVNLFTLNEALEILKGKAGYYAVMKWINERINNKRET